MWAWPGSRDHDNCTVQTAAMGQIPRSTERILVINVFEEKVMFFSTYIQHISDKLHVKYNDWMSFVLPNQQSSNTKRVTVAPKTSLHYLLHGVYHTHKTTKKLLIVKLH